LEVTNEKELAPKEWTLGWNSDRYGITSNFIIRRCSIASINGCYKQIQVGGEGHLMESGLAYSRWCRGLHGTIMTYSFRNEIHKDELKNIENELREIENEMKRDGKTLDEKIEDENKYTTQILDFKNYIKSLNTMIEIHMDDYFPIGKIDEFFF